MNILGIDPGMGGALSFYDGQELIVYDMPTFEIEKNGKLRRKIDISKLASLLKLDKIDHVFVELVSAQPGNGSAAAFTFGFGCGVIESAIVCLSIPFTYVSSMKWKKAMECPKEKDGSRMRASQLLPQYAHNWDRKKDDGRAESALISLYGYKIATK